MSFPLLRVNDTRQALLDLAQGHRDSLPGTVIGISGSVGKTTVKELMAEILSHTGRVARSQGNWNNEVGLPLSVLRMNRDDAFGVFELGISHPGEMKPLAASLHPDWAILTTVGPAHIEFFESEEHIAREKGLLLQSLSSTGGVVLSRDGRWFEVFRTMAVGRCVTVSLHDNGPADYRGVVESGSLRVVRKGRPVLSLRLPLPGRHVAENALLAVALGFELGVKENAMMQAIESYQPLKMRWSTERVSGVTFINDAYNANPLSMRAALNAFEETTEGAGKWVVLGGMHELGNLEREEHVLLGRALAEGPWSGVITVGRRAQWIADGALDGGFEPKRLKRCRDQDEAARALMDARIGQGDCVLLKASRAERMEEVITKYIGYQSLS